MSDSNSQRESKKKNPFFTTVKAYLFRVTWNMDPSRFLKILACKILRVYFSKIALQSYSFFFSCDALASRPVGGRLHYRAMIYSDDDVRRSHKQKSALSYSFQATLQIRHIFVISLTRCLFEAVGRLIKTAHCSLWVRLCETYWQVSVQLLVWLTIRLSCLKFGWRVDRAKTEQKLLFRNIIVCAKVMKTSQAVECSYNCFHLKMLTAEVSPGVKNVTHFLRLHKKTKLSSKQVRLLINGFTEWLPRAREPIELSASIFSVAVAFLCIRLHPYFCTLSAFRNGKNCENLKHQLYMAKYRCKYPASTSCNVRRLQRCNAFSWSCTISRNVWTP